MVQIFMPIRYKGITILDSLIALFLLGITISGFVVFNQTNNRHKEAKQLYSQTEGYAKLYVEYMNNHRDLFILNNTTTLTPNTLLKDGNSWPFDLSTTNLLKQTPNVRIVKNQVTGDLDALMYYVGGIPLHMKTDNTAINRLLVNEAAILLGNKGGVLSNGAVLGNAGWSVKSDSLLIGSGAANNSIVVNIDMIINWNQNIQANTSITKKEYPSNPSNIRTLPGHVINTNTSKADINFMGNSGIVLDKNNAVRLSMVYGSSNNTAMLSLGNNSKDSVIVANNIKLTHQERAGSFCTIAENGKMVVDGGVSSKGLYKYLARSTLVCSKNIILCNTPEYMCYLPSINNRITFKNSIKGIQNVDNKFRCPTAVPFANNVVSSSGGTTNTEVISGVLNNTKYVVLIGYKVIPPNIILSVTCSNMPLFTAVVFN